MIELRRQVYAGKMHSLSRAPFSFLGRVLLGRYFALPPRRRIAVIKIFLHIGKARPSA